MEASSLGKAHDHARAAAVATRQASDTTVAINEHTHAAGEFASAARSTSSVEALRMLKLLEDHHRKLATLLNLPPSNKHQHQSHTGIGEDEVSDEKQHSEKQGAGSDAAVAATKDQQNTETSEAVVSSPASRKSGGATQQRSRIASREMSSSIASNLASARGIRSKYRGQPLVPSVPNDQAPGNLDAHPRRDGSQTKMQNLIDHQTGKPTWVPPMPDSPSKSSKSSSKRRAAVVTPPSSDNAAADDTGYKLFSNTFGSLINRISAPLAFAGLPLISEESTNNSEALQGPESSPSSKRKQVQAPPPSHSSSTSHDPDLSKIYSKATMRAITNDAYGPSESFYVVPTSGHTVSYANILTYAEKEKRRLGGAPSSAGGAQTIIRELSGEDEDDFVDARESPVALSDGAQRRVGKARTDRELNNTIEELYTENRSLKDMLDKLTKRLHTFEASAQNMAESYRLMRPGSPLSAGGSVSGGRSKENDDELAAMRQQCERLEKDNKRMQKTLERYREKWETLKAGAKARREAQGGGDSVEDARMS